MGKKLFIAEKPSVAAEFARTLGMGTGRRDGYMESEQYVVTWCVGHLVTMSYPEVYDPALKKWNMNTLPFLPETFRYEVIPAAKKQYETVAGLLNRADVDTIYVCTDSGREGEYIYRLVDMMAGVKGKEKRRVWIDSQTEEEIRRGIREALPESAYDNLSASAFLRAKEDYLMGINFSRVLTLKYGNLIARATGQRYAVISAGRVMTCVLGMVVRREREIREFVKTPFYRVLADCRSGEAGFQAEWRASEGSRYAGTPVLYKENGFKKREDAEALIRMLPHEGAVEQLSRKKEVKNAPLLFNLAELQNECARLFKISPDQTLKIAQELYEKKLTTYPRTDARVLSTAVSKEIAKNIAGLKNVPAVSGFADEIMEKKAFAGIAKTRYVNDKAITDHYAIIPTGQGLSALRTLSPLSAKVYERICRRFLSIFYPPAEYSKVALTIRTETEYRADGSGPVKEETYTERFYASFKALMKEGYLSVLGGKKEKEEKASSAEDASTGEDTEISLSEAKTIAEKLKKGDIINFDGFSVKEGETSPPKRYTSGSMILAMENAGQLIEDEELRAQIKGSGIGTSATRAEILKKLFNIKYLKLNEKTQVITPTMFGEMVNDVVSASIRQLLNPELTASWEKGLTYVSEGSVTEEEYMQKLNHFVRSRTDAVKGASGLSQMQRYLARIPAFYKNGAERPGTSAKKKGKATAASSAETKTAAASKTNKE
ncbi:MAG: DNA topoisomerase [Eubacteriales bacterium]|nr:DNA topoisomerase [Eubacteriales bacterium]